MRPPPYNFKIYFFIVENISFGSVNYNLWTWINFLYDIFLHRKHLKYVNSEKGKPISNKGEVKILLFSQHMHYLARFDMMGRFVVKIDSTRITVVQWKLWPALLSGCSQSAICVSCSHLANGVVTKYVAS